MFKFEKNFLVASFFPFIIAFTIEFFQQELIRGGIDENSFSRMQSGLYIISDILLLFAVWKGKMSQQAKTIWSVILGTGLLYNALVFLTGKRLLTLIFGG